MPRPPIRTCGARWPRSLRHEIVASAPSDAPRRLFINSVGPDLIENSAPRCKRRSSPPPSGMLAVASSDHGIKAGPFSMREPARAPACGAGRGSNAQIRRSGVAGRAIGTDRHAALPVDVVVARQDLLVHLDAPARPVRPQLQISVPGQIGILHIGRARAGGPACLPRSRRRPGTHSPGRAAAGIRGCGSSAAPRRNAG